MVWFIELELLNFHVVYGQIKVVQNMIIWKTKLDSSLYFTYFHFCKQRIPRGFQRDSKHIPTTRHNNVPRAASWASSTSGATRPANTSATAPTISNSAACLPIDKLLKCYMALSYRAYTTHKTCYALSRWKYSSILHDFLRSVACCTPPIGWDSFVQVTDHRIQLAQLGYFLS